MIKKYYLLLLIIPVVLLVQAEAQSLITFTSNEADAMRKAIIELEQQEAQQAKQDSDQRRSIAVSLINSEIKPQLQTPFGTYITQHSLILDNIRFLENQISKAIDGETKSELRKLLDLELADFKQLKQDHAQGRIT